MLNATVRVAFVALLAAALAACGGWYARGTQKHIGGIRSAYVSADSAPRLRDAVRRELSYGGVALTSRKNAAAVIELSDESFDRRVLSVDPDTGKVREIELGLQVGFSVRAKDGQLLVPPEKLTWVQDFVFDEGSLLGTTEQEIVIERELADDAAQTILLRLETVEVPAAEVPAS